MTISLSPPPIPKEPSNVPEGEKRLFDDTQQKLFTPLSAILNEVKDLILKERTIRYP